MKVFLLLLISVTFLQCSTPEYKVCEFTTNDKELKLYHDILTELIEQHFHNGYLRYVSEYLEKYPSTLEFSDTAAFKKDLILAQNRLFNDTSKFATICYRSSLERGPWGYSDRTGFSTLSKTDTAKYIREIKAFITSFSPVWESVADTIAKAQTNYTSESFNLCTSNVIACEQYRDADMGVVRFSKAFLNEDKTKALLYYEFTCGGKCGKGEIILAEFDSQRWTIKKVRQLWIS